jgi:mannose-1-phosphate guanylyltransferase/mannose-6-phosphate isomerase
LGEVAAERYGYPRPKQFCDFGDGASLVEQTLRRAMRLTGAEDRIVASVSRAHRREVDQCLGDWRGVARVEQPSNRDTAPGVLLPVLHVLERDPEAVLYVLPSDHHVSDDARFVEALRAGAADLGDREIALLGAELDGPEPDLGWIVARADDPRPVPAVAAFVEKPGAAELASVWASGAVANTFAMAGKVRAFAELLRRHAPTWWEAASAAQRDPAAMELVYRRLPPCNLSSEVLQRSPSALRVARLTGTRWSDIGTPDRLAAVLTRRLPATAAVG